MASTGGRLARLERILDSVTERETRLLRDLARLRRAHIATHIATRVASLATRGPATAPGD